MVKNMDIWSKWKWQGHLGLMGSATQCHLGTTRAHLVPPGHFATLMIHRSLSRTNTKHLFKLVPTKGHDGEAMDPWAHCHRLGASPTDLPTKFHHVRSSQPP